MTRAKDIRNVPPEGTEIRPGIYHHPRSPDASPERLRQILGSIKLTGPVPPVDFFDDEEEEEELRQGASR